ncbi:hypothetical protein BV20DRAFT_915978, partial [Pilatotrama ljubarskyi]
MSDGLDTSKLLFLPDSAHLGRCSWNDWKRKIRTIADARDATGHLDGTTPAPYEARLKKWTADEKWIKLLLAWNMSSESSAGIEQEGRTAAQIWAQLVTRYE